MPARDAPGGVLLGIEAIPLIAAALAPMSTPVLGLLAVGSISVWVRGPIALTSLELVR